MKIFKSACLLLVLASLVSCASAKTKEIPAPSDTAEVTCPDFVFCNSANVAEGKRATPTETK